MAGYIPAPPVIPAPKIGWQGQDALSIPDAGLAIALGTGFLGRTDPVLQRLTLDGYTDAVAETVSLFLPGTIAPATIGKWTNRHYTGRATIAAIQANLLTAPSSGDANDYYRVKLTDDTGALVAVLPISTPGVSYYDLDATMGVALVTRPTGNPGSNSSWGLATHYTATQAMDLTGVQFPGVGVIDFQSGAHVAGPVRCALWSADWKLLSDAQSWVVASGNRECSFYFPASVHIDAGATFHVTLDMFGFGVLYNTVPFSGNYWQYELSVTTQNGAMTGPATPANNFAGNTFATNIFPTNSDVPTLALAEATNAGSFDWTTGEDVSAVPALSRGYTNSPALSLMGGPSGLTPATGNLTVAVDAVGVAPATPGANLNLRLVLMP